MFNAPLAQMGCSLFWRVEHQCDLLHGTAFQVGLWHCLIPLFQHIPNYRMLYAKQLSVGQRFWILDFGFWILDFGFWILDYFSVQSLAPCGCGVNPKSSI
jgi:hypothetical protein